MRVCAFRHVGTIVVDHRVCHLVSFACIMRFAVHSLHILHCMLHFVRPQYSKKLTILPALCRVNKSLQPTQDGISQHYFQDQACR